MVLLSTCSIGTGVMASDEAAAVALALDENREGEIEELNSEDGDVILSMDD